MIDQNGNLVPDPVAPVAAPAMPAVTPAPAAPGSMMSDPRIATALQDPVFKARLADRLKELAAAQEEGEARARRASWGNALLAFGGGDTAGAQGRLDAARSGPVSALRAKWDAERQTLAEVTGEHEAGTKLAAQDAAQRQLVLAADPASDMSKAGQTLFRHFNPGVLPDDLLGRTSFTQLAQYDPRLKQYIEGSKATAEADKAKADAAKTGAETPEVGPNAQSDRALKAAQANEANAKAAEARLKAPTTMEVAPGWFRTRQMTPEQEQKFREQVVGTNKITSKVDKLLEVLGNYDSALTGEKKAEAETTAKKLLIDLKNEAGLKLNPAAEKMYDAMIGDPTKVSAKNILGLSHNRHQLETFKNLTQQDLNEYAKVNGFVQGQQPQAKAEQSQPKAPPVAAHPQDSEAVAWAKAHSGDPYAAEILKVNGG